MDVTKYTLGNSKAREAYNNIITSANAYSLTLTINPRYYCLPVNEQYNKSMREVKILMRNLSHYYNEMFITPEFTKDYNIHYHIYFKMTCEDYVTFEQNFKKYRNQTKLLGYNYRLKKVDEVTEELKGYPFKDIERTTRYSNVDNCLFKAYHFLFKSTEGTIPYEKCKPTGSIDIIKFIEFVNSKIK